MRGLTVENEAGLESASHPDLTFEVSGTTSAAAPELSEITIADVSSDPQVSHVRSGQEELVQHARF